MRTLILALTAASGIGLAVPASAQTFHAGVGFGPGWGVGVGFGPSWGHYDYGHRAWWGGPGYYDYAWGGRSVDFYAAAPRSRSYVVVRERPRRAARTVIRERRMLGDGYGAYAYSPGFTTYSGPTYSAPYVGVGFGFGPRSGWWYD